MAKPSDSVVSAPDAIMRESEGTKMTGYVDADLHKDVVAAGARPILQKPFGIDQLVRRIREVVKS